MTERVDDYDYEYPAEAVAQMPPPEREDARLLRVRRFGDVEGEGRVPDLLDALRPGDLMVVNDVAVMPARLTATREATGGRVSLLVLSADGRRAEVLVGARGTLLPGEKLVIGGDVWTLVDCGAEGRAVVAVTEGRDIDGLLSDVGRMPLPPYIRRDPITDERDDLDRERYQTTFARPADGRLTERAAVAAPTAGLHLTPELLTTAQSGGVVVGRVRLEVGMGTFRPIRVDRLADHHMHAETYAVSDELVEQFEAARTAGARVVAVGTTVVRALESAVDEHGRLTPGRRCTSLFIRPGHEFRAVDALLTNFHQPRSSLLVLVAAFAGRDTILAAYRDAIGRGFRLFSYGDAMFLHGGPEG